MLAKLLIAAALVVTTVTAASAECAWVLSSQAFMTGLLLTRAA